MKRRQPLFMPGSRVKLSAAGLKLLWATKATKERPGTVIGNIRQPKGAHKPGYCVQVMWDGRKSKDSLHETFVELYDQTKA